MRIGRLAKWFKTSLSVREVWGSIPRPVKSVTASPTARHPSIFLRSGVAQALGRGFGPHNSLHNSV